ncbi:hypothetical protein ACQ86F_03320 [Streptomyces venezuelae ATCC 10712]
MSGAADAARTEPTAAERIRSVLVRAVSLSLTTEGRVYDLIGVHSVDGKGRISLHPRPAALWPRRSRPRRAAASPRSWSSPT